VNLDKLSQGDRIVAGAGILLFLDLLIFPWHHVSAGFGAFHVTVNRTALESPNGGLGVLAWLVTILVVVVVVVRKLTTARLPDLPIPWRQATFYGTIAVAALVVIKLIAKTEALGWGCYVAVLLAAAMVYGGFLLSKEPEAA
jgi:hypothetical protein